MVTSTDFLFRALAETDLEITRQWRNHTDSLQWFGDSQPVAAEAQRRWFASRANARDDEIYLLCSGCNRPLGQFSVYRIDHDSRRAEVGRFLVDPALRGLGYFDAGLVRLLQLCHQRHQLQSVYLQVKCDNYRAINAYRRNGFDTVKSDDQMLVMQRCVI